MNSKFRSAPIRVEARRARSSRICAAETFHTQKKTRRNRLKMRAPWVQLGHLDNSNKAGSPARSGPTGEPWSRRLKSASNADVATKPAMAEELSPGRRCRKFSQVR